MNPDPAYLWYVVTAAVLGIVASVWVRRRRAAATPSSIPMLSIDELQALMASGAGSVLDVRTPADFNGEQGHLAGALNLPLEELPSRLAALGEDRRQVIAIVCRTDRKAAAAAAILAKQGYTHARAVRGGMTAWRARGWSTTRDSVQT